MTENEQKAAAKQFVKDWTGRGDEKQETQSFWLALLHNVFGVGEPEKHIQFEVKVKLSHTSFIDAYLPDTNRGPEGKNRTNRTGNFGCPCKVSRLFSCRSVR